MADALGLPVRCFIDTEDPTGQLRSAHPTTMTMKSDIDLDLASRRVHLVDGGCFLHKSSNGVLFEMHASEGFWLFAAPPDHASSNTYGTIFNFHEDMTCFPTTTLRYHEKFPARVTVVCTQHDGEPVKDTIFERTEVVQIETLFPDKNFMRRCESLGFNRNNSIVSLMPLLTYISDRSI